MLRTFLIALQLLFMTLSPLFGAVVISERPVAEIKGDITNLDQPEGLSFSPNGDLLAVANAKNNCLNVYARIGDNGPNYDPVPVCVLRTKPFFDYLHELDFSPCGNFLAAASKSSHSIVCLKRNDSEEISFDEKPYWVLDHISVPEMQITADVAFSASGEFIGATNREGGSTLVLFKRLPGTVCDYDPSPFQVITESALDAYGIAPVHGLAFSPDGRKLALTCKRFWGPKEGQPAIAIFEQESEGVGLFLPSYLLPFSVKICPHSIAFHPSSQYLAMADDEGAVMIFGEAEDGSALRLIHTIPVEKRTTIDDRGMQETVKGISFSPCGNYLAFSTMNDSILLYHFQVE